MLEGVYYKTISRNLVTGETMFIITPGKGYKSKNGLITCKGKISVYVKGMPIMLEGNYNGEVFAVTKADVPTGTREQVYKMLLYIDDSISETRIDKIAELTNNDIIGYVKNDGDRVAMLRCLVSDNMINAVRAGTADDKTVQRYINSRNVVKKIYTKITTMLYQEVMVRKLLGFGVDIGKIELLCKKGVKFNDIAKNPYMTLLRFGISISACEAFACENGLKDEYSMKRLCGFVYDALDYTKRCGDTCCEINRLVNIANERMMRYSAFPCNGIFSKTLIYLCIKKLDKYMGCHMHNGRVYVYFNNIFDEESAVVRNIKRLQENRKTVKHEIAIEEIEKETGFIYNKEQREVFKALDTTGVKILTGPPGSGKTAVIKGLMKYYGKPCHLSATTGMAAQVMQEACGQQAETVHRMLNITPFDEKLYGRTLNEPVPEDFVVIDEMSMCGLQLLAVTLSGIKSGSTLLLVGDEDQLQSVEYGSVLHDLIKSGVVEVYRLKEVLRQSGSICANAVKINQGVNTLEEDSKFKIRYFSDNQMAAQAVKAAATSKSTILSPIKAYANYGTRYLNKMLQGVSQEILMSYGDIDYRLHDKVVMTDNNYTEGYVNGDIGEITGIDNGCLVVKFSEDRVLRIERDCMSDMDLAYALTIHRSQGSGFDDVHIILQDTASVMLSRRLLYTAVTRAKNNVTIYSVGDSVNTAISNTREYKRHSLLFSLLQK